MYIYSASPGKKYTCSNDVFNFTEKNRINEESWNVRSDENPWMKLQLQSQTCWHHAGDSYQATLYKIYQKSREIRCRELYEKLQSQLDELCSELKNKEDEILADKNVEYKSELYSSQRNKKEDTNNLRSLQTTDDEEIVEDFSNASELPCDRKISDGTPKVTSDFVPSEDTTCPGHTSPRTKKIVTSCDSHPSVDFKDFWCNRNDHELSEVQKSSFLINNSSTLNALDNLYLKDALQKKKLYKILMSRKCLSLPHEFRTASFPVDPAHFASYVDLSRNEQCPLQYCNDDAKRHVVDPLQKDAIKMLWSTPNIQDAPTEDKSIPKSDLINIVTTTAKKTQAQPMAPVVQFPFTGWPIPTHTTLDAQPIPVRIRYQVPDVFQSGKLSAAALKKNRLKHTNQYVVYDPANPSAQPRRVPTPTPISEDLPQIEEEKHDEESYQVIPLRKSLSTKLHGHYTTADYFKYAVHKIAAESKMKPDEGTDKMEASMLETSVQTASNGNKNLKHNSIRLKCASEEGRFTHPSPVYTYAQAANPEHGHAPSFQRLQALTNTTKHDVKTTYASSTQYRVGSASKGIQLFSRPMSEFQNIVKAKDITGREAVAPGMSYKIPRPENVKFSQPPPNMPMTRCMPPPFIQPMMAPMSALMPVRTRTLTHHLSPALRRTTNQTLSDQRFLMYAYPPPPLLSLARTTSIGRPTTALVTECMKTTRKIQQTNSNQNHDNLIQVPLDKSK